MLSKQLRLVNVVQHKSNQLWLTNAQLR